MITTVITTGSIIANRFRTSAAPISAEMSQAESSFKQKKNLKKKKEKLKFRY